MQAGLWPEADGGFVAVVTIDGGVDSIKARYLARSFEKATDAGVELVVVNLNIPGGLRVSTLDMVKSSLGAEIPVAVCKSPSGAKVAWAGALITAATEAEAMGRKGEA